MFPAELEGEAFRACNGEFGWTRAQVPAVVKILRTHAMGILGGELWWVPAGSEVWHGRIPQKQGPPGVYTWTTERHPGEAWQHFIERGAYEALAAAERWPEPGDLPPVLPGRILYNLTWISEADYPRLKVRER